MVSMHTGPRVGLDHKGEHSGLGMGDTWSSTTGLYTLGTTLMLTGLQAA